jgi:hypothetical protein
VFSPFAFVVDGTVVGDEIEAVVAFDRVAVFDVFEFCVGEMAELGDPFSVGPAPGAQRYA